LEGFIDKIKSTIESYHDQDKTNTKSRIISPLRKKLERDPKEEKLGSSIPSISPPVQLISNSLCNWGDRPFLKIKGLEQEIDPVFTDS